MKPRGGSLKMPSNTLQRMADLAALDARTPLDITSNTVIQSYDHKADRSDSQLYDQSEGQSEGLTTDKQADRTTDHKTDRPSGRKADKPARRKTREMVEAEAATKAASKLTAVTLKIPEEYDDWLEEVIARERIENKKRVLKQDLVAEGLRLLYIQRSGLDPLV